METRPIKNLRSTPVISTRRCIRTKKVILTLFPVNKFLSLPKNFITFILLYFLLGLAPTSFAADCYISTIGAGKLNGSSVTNAYAWKNGAGFTSCLNQAVAGDTIYLAAGDYTLTNTLKWTKSGTDGHPITLAGSGLPAASGDFAKSVLDAKKGWPTINGNSTASFIEFPKGISYVAIKQLSLLRFQYPFKAKSFKNSYMTITDIYVEDPRIVFYVVADSTCNENIKGIMKYIGGNGIMPGTGNRIVGQVSKAAATIGYVEGNGMSGILYLTSLPIFINNEIITDGVGFYGKIDGYPTYAYSCAAADSSHDWTVARIYANGIAKRFFRSEGVKNSTIADIFADTMDIRGQIHWEDFPMLFHFDGASHDNTLTRIVAKNPGKITNSSYDNGDCFATENLTAHINFNECYCYDAFDGGFDLKGGPHTISNSVVLKSKRSVRVWHGPITITNSLAGFDKEGIFTQYATGSAAGIWVQGIVDATRFTSLNNHNPYRFDGKSLFSLPYTAGYGGLPNAGDIVTGASSGKSAKIAGYAGSAQEGTLYIYNRTGPFDSAEIIKAPTNAFSAVAITRGDQIQEGVLTTTNCVVALDRDHTNDSVEKIDECGGCGKLISSGDVAWIEGILGENPQYKNSTNKDFDVNSDDFNSALYGQTKGYYNSIPK